MGRKEQLPIIIFSVFRANETNEYNKDVHETVKVSLQSKNIGFKELMGVYNGVSELSLLVLANHENVVKDLCAQFKQECYLFSGPDRNSELVYPDNRRESIGTLQRISEHEAKTLKSFTYDFTDNSFWACK